MATKTRKRHSAAKPQPERSADFSPHRVSNRRSEGKDPAQRRRRALKRNEFRAPIIVSIREEMAGLWHKNIRFGCFLCLSARIIPGLVCFMVALVLMDFLAFGFFSGSR